MNKPDSTRRKQPNTRRNFNVKGQLVGKLGYDGLDDLLAQLAKVTVEPKKSGRRRNRRRKPVAR